MRDPRIVALFIVVSCPIEAALVLAAALRTEPYLFNTERVIQRACVRNHTPLPLTLSSG